MKIAVAVSFFSLAAVFVSSQLAAHDLFLQMRVERSRCCIPRYNYRAGQSPAVSAVVSEPAILMLAPGDDVQGEFMAVPPTAGATPVRLFETNRAFVFNEVLAGPLVLSGLGASTNSHGQILVTGILNHTGGDSGQLLGGKAVLRVEPLTATGTTVQNSTALAVRETMYWVRRNEPETVQICVQYAPHHNGGFGDVERVRVFLEYHPNR